MTFAQNENKSGPELQPAGPIPQKTPNWVGNLFNFKGRINRGGFWRFQLFAAVFISQPFPIILLALVPIFLAVASRRLYDLNKSSWWLLLFSGGPLFVAGAVALIELPTFRFVAALISILLQTWAIVELGFRPGQVGSNRFGADPLQAAPQNDTLGGTAHKTMAYICNCFDCGWHVGHGRDSRPTILCFLEIADAYPF